MKIHTIHTTNSRAVEFIKDDQHLKIVHIKGFSSVTRWFTTIGVFLFVLCILSLLCVPEVSAYGTKTHWDITADALGPEGFSTDAIQRIQVYNTMDDLATVAETNIRIPPANAYIPLRPYIWLDQRADSQYISQNLDHNAHFQKKSNYTMLNNEWCRLENATYDAVKEAEANGDARGLLAVIGMSTHTVQDFYAHSNWADLTDAGYFDAGGNARDATWFDVSDYGKSTLGEELYSDHNDAEHQIPHDAIAKDDPGRAHYNTSYREAYYATVQWTKLIKSWVSPEFWDEAMAYTNDIPDDDTRFRLMEICWWAGYWQCSYSEDYGELIDYLTSSTWVHPNPWAESYYGTFQDYARIVYDQNHGVVDHESNYEFIPEVKWLELRSYYLHDIDGEMDTWPNTADFFTIVNVHNVEHYEAPAEDENELYPYNWVTIEPIPWNEVSMRVYYWAYDEDEWDEPLQAVDVSMINDIKYWSEELPVAQDYSQDTLAWVDTWGNGGDNDGERAHARFMWFTEMVKRVNMPPVANIGGPYSGFEGTPLSLSADASTDINGDTLQYRWDFQTEDEWEREWDTPFSTSPTVTYTPTDNGVVTATVQVWDGQLSTLAYTLITVGNVAPTVEAGPGATINEGSEFSYAGSFTDPGADTWTATVDYGDGTGAQTLALTGSAFELKHTYTDNKPANAPYTVTVTVTDKDGAVGSDTCEVTVLNVAPSVTMGAFDQPNPAFILPVVHTITFHGTFTDLGADTWTYNWDFGDGTPTVSGTTALVGLTQEHAFGTPGDYTVKLTVTDDDGGSSYSTTVVHVASLSEVTDIVNQYIQSLPDNAFTGNAKQQKNAFNNVFNALDDKIADEEWNGYITSIQSNVRSKADGTVDGKPNNDWINTGADQQYICTGIDDLIAYVQTLI